MNSIQQSLSSLLSNPALQADRPEARGGQARSARPESGAATERPAMSFSDGARQALAAQNQSARLALVGDPGEARQLTRLATDALRSGDPFSLAAHRSVSGEQAARLLR